MSRNLAVYFSLLSPWAYIGQGELRRLAGKHDLVIDWRPVSLMQVFPETGGLPLPKRHPSRQDYRLLELQRWRDKRGLSFNIHPQFWPFDPSLGDRVICALVKAGVDPEKFIAAAFAGTFEQNRNLADEADIAALLEETGYGAQWLQEAKGDEADSTYRKNLAQALASGVFGSPSYVLDGEVFWGQDRLDLLDDALTSGRAAFIPVAK
jgi:2-hydroxychromene-2-carboxylate isomerase